MDAARPARQRVSLDGRAGHDNYAVIGIEPGGAQRQRRRAAPGKRHRAAGQLPGRLARFQPGGHQPDGRRRQDRGAGHRR